jgi:hypothetical protein
MSNELHTSKATKAIESSSSVTISLTDDYCFSFEVTFGKACIHVCCIESKYCNPFAALFCGQLSAAFGRGTPVLRGRDHSATFVEALIN